MPRAIADINLAALTHNFNRVRECIAPSCKILSMIKANAYGHGALQVAHQLKDSDAFGVACIAEAIPLRDAGIKNRIVIMAGFNDPHELLNASQFGCDVVVHTENQVELLEQCKLKRPMNVWLKLDTGMHRLGFSVADAEIILARLDRCANVAKPITLMTHFANADEVEHPLNHQQLEKFLAFTRHKNNPQSLANSAGICADKTIHADWVRPGIMLYGVSPFGVMNHYDLNLKPVMTLKSRLIAIHPLKKGDMIGYGSTYQCLEDMLVGVVAMGYGDGYPRQAQNGTSVLIHNKHCPLVGRVSMDLITVDLRPCSRANINDEVILWGEGLPIELVADASSTIGYELLCQVTSRVIRNIVNH